MRLFKIVLRNGTIMFGVYHQLNVYIHGNTREVELKKVEAEKHYK